AVMRERVPKPPTPEVLGCVGEAHFRRRFEECFGVRRWWYRREAALLENVPFVFETAVAETDRPGALFHGVNFSPTFEDPLGGTPLHHQQVSAFGVSGFCQTAHA